MGIREKYELGTFPIAIGEKKLKLYRIENWDVFVNNLEQKGDAYIKEFPFWVKIWEASIVLAHHLVQIEFEKEQAILEIGAGMGVTGLFLGACGHKVTITDYEDDALELLRMNVELNGLKNVSIRKLDWHNPDLTEEYDVILGSELVYNETSIDPIIQLFRTYLRPTGTVFLAHDIQRMCLIKLIGMVPGRFDLENVVKTFNGANKQSRVVIHTLRLRP
ncbi:MAG: methyltransferase domain-containing protein [Deltaproteobacteria bacterium]|nr:methyltransferase domain-containing protein [Deltaproteobacteria bacterium]